MASLLVFRVGVLALSGASADKTGFLPSLEVLECTYFLIFERSDVHT